MATGKATDQKKVGTNTETLWRKPIILDDEESDDPLASLYQGREVGTAKSTPQISIQPKEVVKAESLKEKSKNIVKTKTPAEKNKGQNAQAEPLAEVIETTLKSTHKMTESELKKVLKIKSEKFQFTDIREILRGKSLDMYLYLRHLAGETGYCKIKHLDLMKKLDISRPTLFKQGDWLTTLSLIEKQNVPGDHFGTSYTVYQLEDVLPVSPKLKQQLEEHLAGLTEAFD